MDLESMTEAQLWEASGVEQGDVRGRILRALSDRLFKRRAFEESAATCESAAAVFQAEGLLLDEGWARYGLGAALWHLERWAPAAKTYVAAAELFRLAGDDSDVALALSDAADAYDEDGQPELALEHWQTAVDLYRASGDDEAAANNASRRAGKLAANRRYEEALVTFRSARELAQAAGKPSLVASIDERMSITLKELGRTDEALAALESALHVAVMLDNESRVAYIRLLVGLAQASGGRHEAALTTLTTARELGEKSKNHAVIARSDLYIARCLNSLGRWDESRTFATRAVHLLDSLGRHVDKHIAQGSLAYSASALGDDALAEDLYRGALAGLRELDEGHLVLDTVGELAGTLIKLERPAEALALLDADPDPRPITEHSRGGVTALYRRAAALHATGDSAGASETLHDIVGQLEGTPHRRDLARALSLLSRLDIDSGGPIDEWLRIRAIALYASVGDLQQVQRLSELFLSPEYAARRSTSASPAPSVGEQRQYSDDTEAAAVLD